MPASDSPAVSATGQAPGKVGGGSAARFFHVGTAAVLIAFVVWGFHHFYLAGQAYPGRPLTPPIRNLIILHAVTMALWMILMLVQPLLVATGRRSVHMMVGRFGAVFAGFIVLLGFKLGIEGARVAPPEAVIWGLPPDEFLAVPILSMVLFGGFVLAGVLTRRRREIHRAMMLLGTFAAMGAAVSRIDPISNLYIGTVWERLYGPFLGTVIIALLLLPAKWLVTRKWDRPYAAGWVVLAVSGLLIMQVATTGAWHAFAAFLMG